MRHIFFKNVLYMFESIDGVFFITIATLSCGFFGLVIRYCLKSKCENISCCYGLISVKRNVELKTQEEIREMELGIKEEKV